MKRKRLRLEDDELPRRKRERLETKEEHLEAQYSRAQLRFEVRRERRLQQRYAGAVEKVRLYQERADECAAALKNEYGLDVSRPQSARPPKPNLKPATADFVECIRNLGDPQMRRSASHELTHMFKPLEDS